MTGIYSVSVLALPPEDINGCAISLWHYNKKSRLRRLAGDFLPKEAVLDTERRPPPSATIYALKFVLLTALMWVTLAFTLFNTGDKLDKYMQDLFNTHFGELIYPDDQTDSVSVLLLTDQIVDGALDGQWPAPYTFHASVLDDLLQHQPAALFIDFYWLNRLKPGGDYLVEVLEAYRAAEIPVYLAAGSNEWFKTFWPELSGLVTPVSASVALDSSDFISRRYPLSHNGLTSAAYAIAQDLTGVSDLGETRGGMDIFWGTQKNPRNWAWMEGAADQNQDWVSTVTDGFSSVGTVIPYTTTVFVRDLINPVGVTEDAAHAELSDHLKGRAVVYGANLAGIQDYVFAPTRNILPGAYYHAMALDNLLTWGDEYKTDVANFGGYHARYFPLWLIQLFALMPLSLAIIWWFNRHLEPAHTKLDAPRTAADRVRSTVFWALITFYVLSIFWFQFTVLDLSVATWIGFIEVLSVGVVVEKLDSVEKILAGVKKGWVWFTPHMLKAGLWVTAPLQTAWRLVRALTQRVYRGNSNDQIGNDSFHDDPGYSTVGPTGGSEQPDN